MNQEKYSQLLHELVVISKNLNVLGIEYRLGGSFALNVHAGHAVINAEDLDFVCKTKSAHDQFVDALQSKQGYTQTEQQHWTTDTGEENINTKLTAPTGVFVEVAWVNDILLSDQEERLLVDSCPISLFTLADLKTTYTEFADRKAGTEEKLRVIDTLL